MAINQGGRPVKAALAWANRKAPRHFRYRFHALELSRFEQARLTATTRTIERACQRRADLASRY
jgi:hypothetical protein